MKGPSVRSTVPKALPFGEPISREGDGLVFVSGIHRCDIASSRPSSSSGTFSEASTWRYDHPVMFCQKMSRQGRLRLPTVASTFVVSACVLLAACQPKPEPFTLTIAHTNDTHARILEVDGRGGNCRDDASAAGECFGGVARRATALAAAREARPNLLLLDGGDQFQGTVFYSKYKGSLTAEVMRRLEYDAMVVGNHEFDDGPLVLAEFAANVPFPVLGTNVSVTPGHPLDDHLSKNAIVEVAGHRIGLLGFITEETSKLSQPGPDVEFLPIESTLRAEIERFEDEGIDIIIALSHAASRAT